MTDFGTDVSTFPDLDLTFSLRSGAHVVGEACARRLVTPRGSLFYDPKYGFDLRALMNTPLVVAQLPLIASQVEQEMLKDERVQSAQAFLTLNTATQVLRVQVLLATSAGPFRFVLNVGATSFTYEQQN